MKDMNNAAKAVVEKMFEAFANGDADGFVATVSENTKWIYHGTQIIPAGVFENKEGVRAFYTNIIERTEIISFEPQQYCRRKYGSCAWARAPKSYSLRKRIKAKVGSNLYSRK